MPLLLLDLDNTLVDRAAAFLKWAQRFTELHGGDVDWLIEADADGYEPRDRLAERIRDRLHLGDAAMAQLRADLDSGMADFLVLDPAVCEALQLARDHGWVTVVVTNGRVVQQERKLKVTELDQIVAGWVISEGVGARKPDPEIFHAATRLVGGSFDGAWMVGDSPHADIEGASGLGIPSVWLHRGRTWTESGFAPTAIAASCAEAVRYVLVNGV